MRSSIGWGSLLTGLVFLTGLSGAIGAEEARFVYVAEKLPSVSSDYQGVGVADGGQDVYLYLSRQSEQGLMVRWVKEKENWRSIEVDMAEVSSPGGETGIGWADIDGDGDLDVYIGPGMPRRS